MKSSRFFLPLFFAFALLFTQQVGAAHALNHALEQQDKKSTHSAAACEQCATYAQLGSALTTPVHQLALLATADEQITQPRFAFYSLAALTASARGPPLSA